MALEIEGRFDEAFMHLYVVGLASILEDADQQRICRLWWKDREHAMLETSDDVTWEECARIVHEHANRWNNSVSLHARGIYVDSKETKKKSKNGVDSSRATLSPRLGTPNNAENWQKLEYNRQCAIDGLTTLLDRRYIGSLGEPSYWSGDTSSNGYTPDRGASRWEMVTRNRGQEFISGRLLPLAQSVSERTDAAVSSGLRGVTVCDETGKDKDDSRTPTGLRRPSQTDNAKAWCALFGVSVFPVFKSIGALKASTAAFFQLAYQNPFAILPIWEEKWVSDEEGVGNHWTLEKYRSIVRSAHLLQVGISEAQSKRETSQVIEVSHRQLLEQKAMQWLRSQGVMGCMLFSQYVSDNKTAPERWLQKGEFIPLVQGDEYVH